MKKFLFYTLTLLAGLILFVLVVKEVGIKEITKTIESFSFWKWAAVIGIGLLAFFFGALRWRYIIKTLTGKSVRLKLIVFARTIGWTIAYITPIAYIGGEPHKVFLLKEEGGIEWEAAGASVIIDEVLDLSVALLFLIVGTIFLFLKFSVPKIIMLVLGGAMATCVILWLIFWRQTKNGKGFLSFFIDLFQLNKIKWVNNVHEKIKKAESQTADFFKNHKQAFFNSLFLAFLERLILITDFWLIVEFLGKHINIFQIMGIMALSVAVYFLPLPASLGGHEASQTIIFKLFNLGSNTGLVFSLIIRILSLAGVMVGLTFLLNFEFKIIKQKAAKFGERLADFLNRFS